MKQIVMKVDLIDLLTYIKLLRTRMSPFIILYKEIQ